MSTPRRPTGAHRRPGGEPVVSIVDTTEIRWFVPGPLPADVGRWFTGSTGVVEERRDTYRLGDRVDVGVKYRGGTTLELKARQRIGRRIDLGDGLAGAVEVWRKWTPADALVDDPAAGRWADVDKVIVKRRFLADGTEVAFSSDHGRGPGCDVEVADVRVGAVAAWTFAFAAFGPPSTRRAALVASWEGIGAGTPGSPSLGIDAGRAMGYPAWLARMSGRTSGVVHVEREAGREPCEL